MPRIPKTISQIVESQLPAFVRQQDPRFVEFLKKYYEWMEKNGADVYTAKILGSSPTTIVLPNTASTVLNGYAGMCVVALNGPAKGHTRPIQSYDPATNTAVVFPAWTQGYIPPPNTNMVIRDAMFPDKLLQYRDIDTTLDTFLTFFKDEFLYQIPGNILADKRKILKHIKQFYQARGNENSFRFLFRILFDEEIQFYYPKVDLLRFDQARWQIDHMMRITTTGDTFNWTARLVTGTLSGATASVEAVYQNYIFGNLITDLYVSNITGTFGDPQNNSGPEPLMISYPYNPPPQTKLGSVTDLLEPSVITQYEVTYQLLTGLAITNGGNDYQIGDQINITGGGELSPAQGFVSAISQQYYTGVAQTPPTTYYLEPYWGANDGTDAEDTDPTQDGVVLPGLYFYDDVQSDITENDLLTANEILLASTETDQDNFYAGDQISLVGGTGVGQERTIIAYNGTTKVATVNAPFNPVPDGTTQYSIFHIRGAITAVTLINFGLGFTSTPTVTITSAFGNSAVLIPVLGVLGTFPGRWLPGQNGGIGSLPTTPDSLLDTNKVIQDSYYWQDFSYDIQSGTTIDKYRDIVKTLLHPAGMQMFGSVWIQSSPDNIENGFVDLVDKQLGIEIDAQVFDGKLELGYSEKIIQLQGEDNVVIGAKNKDLDGFKFVVFPPGSNFNLLYPYPNQNYWTTPGLGNTQISNFKDIIIGSIVNNPGRRTKIAFDSYINIDSSDLTTFVGCVGPNMRTLERAKFFGFPPYPDFPIVYPSPNQNYWDGPGNTQIKDIKNIQLIDVITTPEQNRSNFCVDSDIQMFQDDSGTPVVGDVVEYAFLQGNNSQIVYNVSPNSHANLMNGVFGNNKTVETADPAFDSYGIIVSASDSQFVNASAVPVYLKQASVIVVAQPLDLTTDHSVATSIQFGSDNGYSIDITQTGELFFRSQYGGNTTVVSYPASTVALDDWFMATMTFDNGLLTGQFNLETPVKAQFPSYPLAPISNSLGWFFGKASVSYTTVSENAALFNGSLFGSTKYRQALVSSETITFDFFSGRYAYAIFFDRALYDYEVTSIYKGLRTMLNTTRGIVLP